MKTARIWFANRWVKAEVMEKDDFYYLVQMLQAKQIHSDEGGCIYSFCGATFISSHNGSDYDYYRVMGEYPIPRGPIEQMSYDDLQQLAYLCSMKSRASDKYQTVMCLLSAYHKYSDLARAKRQELRR